MFVVPFRWARSARRIAHIGVELTDSPYGGHYNMRIMTRMGLAAVYDVLKAGAGAVSLFPACIRCWRAIAGGAEGRAVAVQ